MSQPELRAALLEEPPDAPAELSPDERFFLGALVALAALVERHAVAYPELVRGRERGEAPDALRARALDAAEQIAMVGQQLMRHQDLLLVALQQRANPGAALSVADTLFFSYTLLAGPEDERTEGVITLVELDYALDDDGLRLWLSEMGVAPPGTTADG